VVGDCLEIVVFGLMINWVKVTWYQCEVCPKLKIEILLQKFQVQILGKI
jgi:hypothetical protein